MTYFNLYVFHELSSTNFQPIKALFSSNPGFKKIMNYDSPLIEASTSIHIKYKTKIEVLVLRQENI